MAESSTIGTFNLKNLCTRKLNVNNLSKLYITMITDATALQHFELKTNKQTDSFLPTKFLISGIDSFDHCLALIFILAG